MTRAALAAKGCQLLEAKHFLTTCFVVYLGIRLGLIYAVPVSPVSDALWYFGMAQELTASWTYQEDGVPTAYWPVGYPGLLAILFSATGASVLAAQLANLVFSACTFWLIYDLARKGLRSETAARLSVLLLTVYPNNAAYVPLLLTETAYAFVFLLAIWVFLRRTDALGCLLTGVLFGLGTYIKTQTILFAFLAPFLAYWLARSAGGRSMRRSILSGMLVPLVALLVVLPWTLRNYATFGTFVLVSTNGGTTLLTGNNPSANGDFSPEDALVSQARFSVADQVQADRRARDLALAWIRENPLAFAQLVPKKIWRLWSRDGEGEWAFQAGTPRYDDYEGAFRAVRVINQVYYALVLILAAIGVWTLLRSRDWALDAWIGVVVAIFITGIAVIFSGQSRFHFPAMPFLLTYAAGTLAARCASSMGGLKLRPLPD